MILAKNNILVPIKESKETPYAILNPISGSFDLMENEDYLKYEMLLNNRSTDEEFISYLIERGYAYKSTDEESYAIKKAYNEFTLETQNSQVQLLLIPTYGCNLACVYCFQGGLESKFELITKEAVDSFFKYADTNFVEGPQKPFITLFGGEPLVNSPAQREIINYIVQKCVQHDLELSVVTNGYALTEYIPVLSAAKIKEIQVTLDGSKDIHDSRRGTSNNKGTFDRIISGIEAAIISKIPINLRTVADTQNFDDIINLANFLDSKGWLDLPSELFKTQLGRNYELFECYAKPQHLMSQVELWSKYSTASKSNPVLQKFHRPDFKGIRHLVDTSELYMASFDTCPACKTEWVFDLYGKIYGCTASCGREEYLLGTYWPEVNLNTEAISMWKNRNVHNISKCKDCKYDVICGGGCGVVSANQNNGNALTPDCRPIQEILETGVNHYINDIKKISESDEFKSSSCCSCPPGDKTDGKKTGHKSVKLSLNLKNNLSKRDDKTTGCSVCGEDLSYSDSNSFETKCQFCDKTFKSNVKCSNGHFVCDSCHGGSILTKVEQLLANSKSSNPVKLAKEVFKLPNLNMHGPEYHSIVPAVLVTAYQNSTHSRDLTKIRESIRRGRDVKGGSCGFNGACGAGIGAGIASSVINSSTPMSTLERRDANLATSHSLLAISKFGGPRCCKRESMLSIESFIENSGFFNDQDDEKFICSQFNKNKDCIKNKCKYYYGG